MVCGFSPQGEHHLSQPAGNALPNAAQEAVSRLCCKSALSGHGQFGVPQRPHVLFWPAAFQPVSLQSVPVYEVILLQVPDLAFEIFLQAASPAVNYTINLYHKGLCTNEELSLRNSITANAVRGEGEKKKKKFGIPLQNDIRKKKFFMILKNSDSTFFSL